MAENSEAPAFPSIPRSYNGSIEPRGSPPLRFAWRAPIQEKRMRPRASVFDAYGTLFDVHSVVTAASGITGDLRALSALWRQRQLEYTWLRSLMERYEDFWAVTEAALRSAIRQLRIPADDPQIHRLTKAYLFPSAFEDVRPA